MKNNTQLVTATIVLIVVLAGIFALAWHGTIPGGEAIAVVTTILGLIGGAFAVHTGVSAGANAAATPTTVLPVTTSLHVDGKKLGEAIANAKVPSSGGTDPS